MAVSFPLQDPGADAAHGVRLTPQAVFGHVVLQHPQPHSLAPDKIMTKSWLAHKRRSRMIYTWCFPPWQTVCRWPWWMSPPPPWPRSHWQHWPPHGPHPTHSAHSSAGPLWQSDVRNSGHNHKLCVKTTVCITSSLTVSTPASWDPDCPDLRWGRSRWICVTDCVTRGPGVLMVMGWPRRRGGRHQEANKIYVSNLKLLPVSY